MPDAVDLIKDHMKDRRPKFNLFPYLWEQFDISDLGIFVENWELVKFLDDGLSLNEQTNRIPKDKGGIYVYIIRNPNLPQLANYLMYIGKATRSIANSLYVRIYSYYNKFKNGTESRPYIEILMKNWAKYIYIAYIAIDGDNRIDELETRLISTILPPCNHEIPNKDVRKALVGIDAFN